MNRAPLVFASNNVDVSNDDFIIDTGANVVVTGSKNLIVKHLGDSKNISHVNGHVNAQTVLINTPIGELEGLYIENARNLLPAYVIARDGKFVWDENTCTATFAGRKLCVQIRHGIPVLVSVFPSRKFLSQSSLFSNHPFTIGKRHIYFNKNQNGWLRSLLSINLNSDQNFQEYLFDRFGCSVSPSLVLYCSGTDKQTVVSPYPKKNASDKAARIAEVAGRALFRVSVYDDGFIVSDLNAEVPQHGVHIFFQSSCHGELPSWGGVLLQSYAVQAEDVAPDFSSIIDTSASALMKLVANTTIPNNKTAVDLDFCHDHEKDGFDPRCEKCIEAGLRTKMRKRAKAKVGTTPIKVGVLYVDIALYEKSGPYCLVGATTAEVNGQQKTLMFSEPIMKRETSHVKRALASIILQAQKETGEIITRIHSDKEGAVEKCSDDLQEQLGIRVTFTQGNDPRGNVRAESSVNILCLSARIRLQHFIKNSTKAVTRALWPSAMTHSAQAYTRRQLGKSDDDSVEKALYPFGSIVKCRHPPKMKLSKTESRTFDAVYLSRATRVPGGHVVVKIDPTSQWLQEPKIVLTLTPVTSDGKMVMATPKRAPPKIPAERLVIPTTKRGLIHDDVPKDESEIRFDQPLRRSKRRAAADSKANPIEVIDFCVSEDDFKNSWVDIAMLCDADLEFDVDDPLHLQLQADVTTLCQRWEHQTPAGRAALEAEFSSLLRNGVIGEPRELKDLEAGCEVARLGQILSKKEVEFADSTSYKGRVVYLGDTPSIVTQQGGFLRRLFGSEIEADDVWVSTSSSQECVRSALAYSLLNNLPTWTADMRSAYLQSVAGGRETYCQVPKNLWSCLDEETLRKAQSMKEPRFKLLRALYGRKRSGLDWSLKIQGVLEKLNFVKVQSARGLYMHKDRKICLAIYIDDVIVSCSADDAEWFFSSLQKDIALKEKDGKYYRKTDRFLGLEYFLEEVGTDEKMLRKLKISMKNYCKRFIELFEEEFGIKIKPRKTLPPEPIRGPKSNRGHRYRGVVGSLLWLSRSYRADLCKATGCLGSGIEYWSDSHEDFMIAVLGYLYETKDVEMEFCYNPNDGPDDIRLVAHSDSNLAAPRSCSGGFIYLCSSHGTFLPLQWWSKLQQIACCSTAAAEFCAASLCSEKCAPIAEVCFNLGLISKLEVNMFLDNNAVLLGISRGYAPYDSLIASFGKAVRLRLAQLSDLQAVGGFSYKYISSAKNRADGLTKMLGGQAMAIARKLFGLVHSSE